MSIPRGGQASESRRWLGETLRRWCQQEPHASLNDWRRRDERFGVWSPEDFSVKFSRWLRANSKQPLPMVLAEAGISTAKARAGDLSREAFLELLSQGRAAAQGYDNAHLSIIQVWKEFLVNETAVWSKQLSSSVINGLLEPWATINPPELQFQKLIQETLKVWFGAKSEFWEGTSDLSRAILERWKVLDVMEGYFTRVEKYAQNLGRTTDLAPMAKHWKYRRRFWLAYYRKGGVTRARALIGRGMMEEAGMKNLQGEFGRAMARLDSGTTRHHCGLFLEINGMMVIDLSHNGSALFFLPFENGMLSKDAVTYSLPELRSRAFKTLPHHGSENYQWQAKFAQVIRHHTGVSVDPADYRVFS